MRFLIDAQLHRGCYASMVTISREAPAVVWIRIGNTRRAPMLAWFEPLIDQIVQMLTSGSHLIELR